MMPVGLEPETRQFVTCFNSTVRFLRPQRPLNVGYLSGSSFLLYANSAYCRRKQATALNIIIVVGQAQTNATYEPLSSNHTPLLTMYLLIDMGSPSEANRIKKRIMQVLMQSSHVAGFSRIRPEDFIVCLISTSSH